MVLSYPDTLAAINASLLTESKTYTEEAHFLIGAVNSFTCMGGPNYNEGTTKILDSIAKEYGYREVMRFLYSIKKIKFSDLGTNYDYAYFWNWFKECHENLFDFKREVEERASKINSASLARVIPETIRKEFD